MNEVIDIVTLSLPQVLPVRQEVMYPNAPVEMSMVEGDEGAIHWGLLANGQLVSVISLFDSPQFGHSLQFRKFATLVVSQGKGYGSRLLEAVLTYAAEKKYPGIWCNARVSALAWYQRFGFEITGEPWHKNGLDFIIIYKALK